MNASFVIRVVCVFALTAILVAGSVPTAALAADAVPNVAPFDPVVFGDLAAKSVQWMIAKPTGVSPLLDDTGQHCAQGQSGSIWFLAPPIWAHGPVTRTCPVLAGTRFFFPVFDCGYIGYQTDPNDTPAFARNSAHTCFETDTAGVTLSAKIDNVAFTTQELRAGYRVSALTSTTPVFAVTVPNDNYIKAVLDPSFNARVLCSPAGVCYPTATDGVYLLTDPLTPGEQTIQYSAPGWVEVTYHIVAFELVLYLPQVRRG
ncbi:MAG: hypothetical protein U0X20_22465 [Caldilineaceae bacterium]